MNVIESIPDVLNVVGVLIVTFSIFAVGAVNFLKGDLRHCSGDTFTANIEPDEDAVAFMTNPKSWNEASAYEKAMLGPSSSVRDFSADWGCASPAENCCAAYMSSTRGTTMWRHE